LPPEEAAAKAVSIAVALKYRGPAFLISGATHAGTRDLTEAVMRFIETGEAPAQGNLELPVIVEKPKAVRKAAAAKKKAPAKKTSPKKKSVPRKKAATKKPTAKKPPAKKKPASRTKRSAKRPAKKRARR
jgi:hypothetical protein